MKRLLDSSLPTKHVTTPFDSIEFDPVILDFFAKLPATSYEFRKARDENLLEEFFNYYKQFLNFSANLSGSVKVSQNIMIIFEQISPFIIDARLI